jgi:hypothetical protein
MAGVKPTDSYRDVFKRKELIPLSCEYIFSIVKFIVMYNVVQPIPVQINKWIHSSLLCKCNISISDPALVNKAGLLFIFTAGKQVREK